MVCGSTGTQQSGQEMREASRVDSGGTDIESPQFDFTAEYDRYAGKPRPDPRLLALGAEVGSVREFAEAVLKPYLEGKAKETK